MNAIQKSVITRAERERWLHLVANDQHQERCAQEKKRSRKAWQAWIVVGASAWFVGWLGWHLVQWANRSEFGARVLAILD